MKSEIKHSNLDGYEVVSYYSTDDEAYIAQIPALVGCAADGETREEAFASLRALKAEWIARVAGAGHPVPAPRFAPAGGDAVYA